MGYSSKVGSFNIDTTKTAGQTQAITGIGFQPKIVLFWWGGSTATGDNVSGGTIRVGFGAAVSSTSRFDINFISIDAGASSDTYANRYTTDCIRIWSDATPTVEGIMDFSSMDTGGFTLTVDDQFSNAYRISYLALGGDDLTNVFIGSGALATTTGNYNVNGVGFHPDALIMGSTVFSLGMATGATNQGLIYGMSMDGQDTSNTMGYGYNGEVVTINVSNDRETFVAFTDDGFTLNHLEGTSPYPYSYICLKGGQYSVGELQTRTDGNDIAETFGFQPVALLFASANRTLSTQQVATDHNRLSIGAAVSTTERAVQAISDEDNLATTETAYANYDSAVYAHVKDDAIEALMDIKSIDANGFTCVMDDTETAGCWVTYLAIGAAASSGISGTLTQTQAADSSTLTGALAIAGALIQTQTGDTSEAIGTLAIVGTLAQSQAANTILAEGVGVVSTNGALAQTQADQTITAAATLKLAAALSQSQADATPSITGALVLAGASALTQAADSLISTATLGAAPSASAVLDATQAANTITATGAIAVKASGEMVSGADVLSAAGGLSIKGALNVTEEYDTLYTSNTLYQKTSHIAYAEARAAAKAASRPHIDAEVHASIKGKP